MARFRAKIVNERKKEVTRLGHRNLYVECNGWNLGIRVIASRNENNDDDEFHIHITKGSNNPIVIGAIVVNEGTIKNGKYFIL